MSKYTPDEKRGRPLLLEGKVSRLLLSLTKSSSTEVQPETEETAPGELHVPEEVVASAIHAWRERARFLSPDLLSDPAWAMLLELLHGELQDRRVSLSRLCSISGVSASSAARWIKALESRQLALRRAAPDWTGDEFVELSPRGSAALRRYFREVIQSD